MEQETVTQDEQLTPLEAFALLAAMQAAVDEVPSYVETRAIETWIENSLDNDDE